MIVAIQMDPIASINVSTDTSFLIGLEAQKRGYRLFCYEPKDLSLANEGVFARGHYIEFLENKNPHFKVEGEALLNLEEARYLWIRQDPPFDMAYITATYFLESLTTCKVLNKPSSLRDFSEKLIPFRFKEFMPPTLISRSFQEFECFFAKHKDVVLKPLYGAKGLGVIRLKDKENLGGAHDLFCALEKTPYIMQAFLPEVEKGDKRILFVGGEVIGSFKRIPQSGQIRSNIALGGRPELCELTEKEMQLASVLGPFFLDNEIFLAGIDVIGDYLTEVNITSPTGYVLLNRLNRGKSQEIIWDNLTRM